MTDDSFSYSSAFPFDDHPPTEDALLLSNEAPALHVPSFLHHIPALASGGGAEIFPVGMQPAFWLQNSAMPSRMSKGKHVSSYEAPYRQGQFDYSFDGLFTQSPINPPERRTLEPAPSSTPNTRLYSATGFPALSILARVFNRPYPRIDLGAVDMTCSFVIVDTRRHDHPIVYCSPNFTKLTGYETHEVLGRNCRFLQSPGGVLDPGGARPDAAAQAAAGHLKKHLVADKECQVKIVNYKKDGTPFTNLVSVIPVMGGVGDAPGEENEVVFHVGFQVDCGAQDLAILEHLQTGSYTEEYPPVKVEAMAGVVPARAVGVGGKGDRRGVPVLPPVVVSKEMKKCLADPVFLQSIPVTTKANYQPTGSAAAGEADAVFGGNHPLHMLLLEMGPDFVHVVSLKGAFLYVAPSVRTVLGYQPEDLVGANMADLVHPEDVVPLMRELKESSTGVVGPAGSSEVLGNVPVHGLNPKTVDLMFRARTKCGVHVWVEARGRLYVEPGKGRKAIILTGRAREMADIKWEMIACGGGLAKSVSVEEEDEEGAVTVVQRRQEFWGTVSKKMTLVTVGSAVKDVLGWEVDEFMGRSMLEMAVEPRELAGLVESVEKLGRVGEDEYQAMWTSARCRMRAKDGRGVEVVVNVYRCQRDPRVRHATSVPGGIFPAHLLYQVRLASAEVLSLYSPRGPSSPMRTEAGSGSSAGYPDLKANVFQALDVSRGSSWQYELQQLKFGNRKLQEEIAALEAAIKNAKAKKAMMAQQQQQQQHLPLPMVGGFGSGPSNLFQRRFAGMPTRGGGGVDVGHAMRHTPSGMQPTLSIQLPYPVTAPLPMRDLGVGGSSSSTAGQGYGSGVRGFGEGGGGDYLGTSPFIQRLQDEVAAGMFGMGAGQGQQQQRGQGQQRGAVTPMKRTWGMAQGMDGYR